jgi:hypothetical protein
MAYNILSKVETHMKKKILILENDFSILDEFKQMLGDKYNVFIAYRTDIADLIISENMSTIDCIIFDLNMNNEFIPAEYRDKTMSGSLTGWIWYFYCARGGLKNDPYIIVSTAFADLFIEYINDNSEISSKNEKRAYNSEKIHILSKQNHITMHNGICDLIDKLLNDNEETDL